MSETPEDARVAALRRIRERREFLTHIVSYVVVNVFLVVVWAFTGAGYFWPMWVMGGWGIGLVLHAWTLLTNRPISETEIQREMSRHPHGR